MIKLSSITAHILDIWHRRNSRSYIAHLRSLGIRIGDGCIFRDPLTTRIDVSRPALVSIGSNVDMNTYFQILTHDWASFVFRNKYHDIAYGDWLSTHKAKFSSYDDFIQYVNQKMNETAES